MGRIEQDIAFLRTQLITTFQKSMRLKDMGLSRLFVDEPRTFFCVCGEVAVNSLFFAVFFSLEEGEEVDFLNS